MAETFASSPEFHFLPVYVPNQLFFPVFHEIKKNAVGGPGG